MNTDGDSPFQIYQAFDESPKVLTKEEQEDKQADEIVDLYKKRDSSHSQVTVKHKRSLFDELWEKDHP